MIAKYTSLSVASLFFLLNSSAATHRLPSQQVDSRFSPGQSPAGELLGKRATCADGGICFIGACCGTGCAGSCCAHDNGGIGCPLASNCQFDGNVFIGCCPIGLRCTGEPERITIHTPYSTVTLGPKTTPATTTATTTPSSSVSSYSPSATPSSTAESSTSSRPISRDPMSTTSTATITNAPPTPSVSATPSPGIGVANVAPSLRKIPALVGIVVGAWYIR